MRKKKEENRVPNVDNVGIVELRAENFQKLRVVTIRPDGRPVVMITGPSGAGKTSVLDSIWFVLRGTDAFKRTGRDRRYAIRNGAETMRVSLTMRDGSQRDIVATRSMSQAGNQPPLTITGRGDMTPQDFANGLLSALTFDPLEFIRMEPEDQVKELKKLSHVTLDFAALDKANEEDYAERTLIGREIDMLKGQLAGLGTVLAGLPASKLDVGAIMEKLNRAGEINQRASQADGRKRELGVKAAQLVGDVAKKRSEIEYLEAEIKKLQEQVKRRQTELGTLEEQAAQAEQAWRAAPDGEFIDTKALTAELASAQETNHAIDRRQTYDKLKSQIDAKQHVYDRLTNQRDVREEKKREAIAGAKIPVEGLTFDQTTVRWHGMPLGNLGEGEQLRVSTLIGMASNPKLRVMCIRHGEALDENGLKTIAALAEEHNFQVWMTKVDTSGKVGIVMEDGMIVADNDKDQGKESK